MSLLVVGSVALDSVETPFGSTIDAVGGSAVFFSCAASLLTPVQVVGVVGSDFPPEHLTTLRAKGIDLAGVEHAEGESFRWKGKYSYDLQNRETLETRLGVFADFNPRIPDAFKAARYVLLGNIDPTLQLNVLDQIDNPEFVVCDTMNYWIQSKKEALMALMKRIDVLMVNDAEARQLSGDWNIYRAARWILAHGPRVAIIKQGEYGAVLVEPNDKIFYIPAYPLEEIYDPTGAGDSFAGGFLGHLARSGDLSHENQRRAMVYGATMGSFAVERFSIDRFNEIGVPEVTARTRAFNELVHFDIPHE